MRVARVVVVVRVAVIVDIHEIRGVARNRRALPPILSPQQRLKRNSAEHNLIC